MRSPKRAAAASVFAALMVFTQIPQSHAASAFRGSLAPSHEGIGCTRFGYGESAGEAWCPDSFGEFRIRVWCTWAGYGESPFYHVGWNSATCNRGSVNAIEIISR